MITASININDLEWKDAPLPHHLAGIQYTRTGYGRRIPSAMMVRLPGSPRWRRVYVCCYSNSGTAYVPDKAGNWIVIYGSPLPRDLCPLCGEDRAHRSQHGKHRC